MPESEVARTRREIDLSNEAAERGLSGIACMANHEAIRRRMEQIEVSFQQWRLELSEEQAMEQFCTAMNGLHAEFADAATQGRGHKEDNSK